MYPLSTDTFMQRVKKLCVNNPMHDTHKVYTHTKLTAFKRHYIFIYSNRSITIATILFLMKPHHSIKHITVNHNLTYSSAPQSSYRYKKQVHLFIWWVYIADISMLLLFFIVLELQTAQLLLVWANQQILSYGLTKLQQFINLILCKINNGKI